MYRKGHSELEKVLKWREKMVKKGQNKMVQCCVFLGHCDNEPSETPWQRGDNGPQLNNNSSKNRVKG